MRRERIPIPKPRSNFFSVQCTQCGNEQIIFSATTADVNCRVCDASLAKRTGGTAEILGEVVRRLD